MNTTRFFRLTFYCLFLILMGQVQEQAHSFWGRSATDSTGKVAPELPYQEVLGAVVCQANFPLEEIEEVRQNITELQSDLVKYLGIPIPVERIELCLFDTPENYFSFIRNKYPMAPLDRPALYVKDNGPGVLMVQRDTNMLLNIRHEMTHAILNASLRNVPIWVDEGLAKYFETPQGKRGYENPFLTEVRKNAIGFFGFFGRAPSLERLEKLQQINQMGEKEYRESWAWIHFLIHQSPQTHQILGIYLQSLLPEKQQELTPTDVAQIQKSTPLTRLLKSYFPDYRHDFIEHYKIWETK